jgi:hypothetical protein
VAASETVAFYLNRLKVEANITMIQILNENKKLVGPLLPYTGQMSSPKADWGAPEKGLGKGYRQDRIEPGRPEARGSVQIR